MTDKREWYQAEYWQQFYDGRGEWVIIGFPKLALDKARESASHETRGKTRIVRHTTEVVEEREARG